MSVRIHALAAGATPRAVALLATAVLLLAMSPTVAVAQSSSTDACSLTTQALGDLAAVTAARGSAASASVRRRVARAERTLLALAASPSASSETRRAATTTQRSLNRLWSLAAHVRGSTPANRRAGRRLALGYAEQYLILIVTSVASCK